MLTSCPTNKKMLIFFEIRIERPQQFGYDDDDEGTGVLAVADCFKNWNGFS